MPRLDATLMEVAEVLTAQGVEASTVEVVINRLRPVLAPVLRPTGPLAAAQASFDQLKAVIAALDAS